MNSLLDLNVKQERQYTNLDQYQVYLLDESDRSDNFFNISQFPEEFALGKNAFLITGTNRLRSTSPILIEVIDSNGNVVYHETYDYREGISRMVSVWVYGSASLGQAQITVLSEASVDKSGNPVPDRWVGKYNVKWRRKVNINPNIHNEQQVRFIKTPSVTAGSLTLRELELRYDITGSNPNDRNIVIQGTSTGPKITSTIRPRYTGSNRSLLRSERRSLNENSCGEQLDDFMPFERGMKGGIVTITDVTNNTNLDSKICENFNIDTSNPLKLRITDVINRELAYVRAIGRYSQFPEMIAIQCNGNYKLEFTREDPVQIINKNTGLCLISLQLKGIETVSGSVLRARVYARDFDSDDPFIFIGDFELDPQELMIDLNRQLTPREKRTGVFLNQKDIDDFLEPLNAESKLVHDNRFLLNSVNIQRNIQTSGSSKINLDPIQTNDGASESCKVNPIVGGNVGYDTKNADSDQNVIESIDESNPFIGFKQEIFQFFPEIKFEKDVTYTLSFKTLLNNFGQELENCRFSAFIRYNYDSTKFKEEHILTYEVENGVFNYDSHLQEFAPVIPGSGDSQLIIKIENGNWFFSDISLQPSQKSGFSPDFSTLYFPLDRSQLSDLGNLLEFKVDMFDLNNNRVPYDLRTTSGLDVSSCGQIDEYSYTVIAQDIPSVDNCCFVLGTEVLMGDGTTKLIENLNIGDQIKSRVFSIADLNADDLLDQETNVELLDISFDFRDEIVSINNGNIEVTTDHPFIVYNGPSDGWVIKTASEIEVGDELYSSSDQLTFVNSVQIIDSIVREVVNLNVGGDNVYFANNILTQDKS